MKSKQEAIDYVIKNCYNPVTPEQVDYVIDLLIEFGMQPPPNGESYIIREGVTFKVPTYGWRKDG